MRNLFRRKKVDEASLRVANDGKEETEQNELALHEEALIEIRGEKDSIEIKLYEARTFNEDAVRATHFTDAMIPAAGAIADAATQYSQAIVKFPDGRGWADLLNRVTPGDEGWKTLATMKNKKFDAQAMIKQAKLQPAAVANLALQGAAIVVGQAYMVEINKQLDMLTSGIASIQEEMRLERESNIEAAMATLKEYADDYMLITADMERRQAVKNHIELIRREALEAWVFQVRHMKALQEVIAKTKNPKEKQLKELVSKFNQRERAARDAFLLLMAADQTRMQYHRDFDVEAVSKEKEVLQDRLAEYSRVRDIAQAQLLISIKKLKTRPIAIPEANVKEKRSTNPLQAFMDVAAEQVPRVFLPVMIDEAKRQNEETKKRFHAAVSRNNPLEVAADQQIESLDTIGFIYNEADTLLIDDNGIHFLKQGDPRSSVTDDEDDDIRQ